MTERGKDKKRYIFSEDDRPQQCPECGGRYEFLGHGKYTCENCGKVVYDDFGKIRLFLEENGPSPAVVISEGTGVPVPKITQYVRQGRMEIADGAGNYFTCENCGGPIRFGRYCPSCAAKLNKNYSALLASGEVGEVPKHNGNGKMHIQNLLTRGDKL